MEDEVEVYKRANELEKAKGDGKDFVRKTRLAAQEDLAGMRETAVAALYSLLVHDDPSVRMKAVGLWFSKLVPTVAAERMEEEQEVIEAGAGFDDLAKQIEELKKKANGSGSE